MGDRVYKNKLSVTRVEKYSRRIKLIRITDLLHDGRVQRINNANIGGSINRNIILKRKFMVGSNHN